MTNTYLDRMDNAEPTIETIVAAAIKHRSGAVYWLPRPARHCHVIRHMVDTTGLPPPVGHCGDTQGFMTSANRFVDRREAAAIAIKAGQVEPSKLIHDPPELFSENMW
jgi:hypothetical protein